MPDKYCQTSTITDVYDSIVCAYRTTTRTIFFKVNKKDVLLTNSLLSKHVCKQLCKHHLDNIMAITRADLFDRTSGYISPNLNCFRYTDCDYIHLKPDTELTVVNIT